MTHGAAHMPFFEYLNYAGMYVLAMVLFFGLGRILHELTHVLAANAFGHDVESIELHPLKGRVVYSVNDATPAWQPRLINLSPFIVGVIVAVAFVVTYWNNLPSLLVLYAVGVGWFAYTFMGAASDWSMTAAKADGYLWKPSKGEQMLVLALGLIICAFIASGIEMLGSYTVSFAMGLSLAGVGVLVLGVREINESQA